jgi:uncharacterized membrane protein
MSLYLLMKLLHVLAAFWMISGVVGRGLTFWQAGRVKDVQAARVISILSAPLIQFPRETHMLQSRK